MILVDPRAGSSELVRPLRAMGFEVEEQELEYGDVAFHGNGPDGPILIGIEYKKLPDLIASMDDERLMGHQVPGMLAAYPKRYLVVEGAPLYQSDGTFKSYEPDLHRWRRPFSTRLSLRHLLSFLISVEEHGVQVVMLPSQASVACWVGAVYSWWQKPWDKHSRLYIHERPLGLIMPTLRQRVAATFPGIGKGKLPAIDEAFDNVREMVNATPEQWQQIKGIGKKIALGIQEALIGRN